MSIKSPGGSTFPYYYKGGEIHALKYGSFFEDTARLLGIIDAEEEFVRNRPNQKLRIWVDFYETQLSDEIITRFAGQVLALRGQLIKLAVVGCTAKDRKRIIGALSTVPDLMPCRFFDDPEEAKTWLVTAGA